MNTLKRNLNYKLLAIIIACKFLFLIIGNGFEFGRTYELSKLKGDAKSYLNASNNFIDKGSYEFTDNGDGVTKYVVRMPGMAIILIPLIYFFSVSGAIKIFVVLQVLISSFAFTVLFQFLERRLTSRLLKAGLFLFIIAGSYMNNYSGIVLSETIAQSLFIIICCYMMERKEYGIDRGFIVIALLFTWLFFLRPFMIVFLPFFIIRLMNGNPFKVRLGSFVKQNKHVILFLLILGSITSAWTVRNYLKTREFIPMEYSVKADRVTYLQEFTPDLFNYIKHFGGNIYTSLDDQATSNYLWFYPAETLTRKKIKRPDNSIFPKVVFSDGITMDTLNKIRNLVDSALKFRYNSPERLAYLTMFKSHIARADQAVLNNTGFWFHASLRGKNLLKFIKPTIPQNKYYLNSAKLKLIAGWTDRLLNLIFITLFIVMIPVVFLFMRRSFSGYYYLLVPSYLLIFLFACYFNISEERELFCFYPAYLITGCLLFDKAIGSLRIFFGKNADRSGRVGL